MVQQRSVISSPSMIIQPSMVVAKQLCFVVLTMKKKHAMVIPQICRSYLKYGGYTANIVGYIPNTMIVPWLYHDYSMVTSVYDLNSPRSMAIRRTSGFVGCFGRWTDPGFSHPGTFRVAGAMSGLVGLPAGNLRQNWKLLCTVSLFIKLVIFIYFP